MYFLHTLSFRILSVFLAAVLSAWTLAACAPTGTPSETDASETRDPSIRYEDFDGEEDVIYMDGQTSGIRIVRLTHISEARGEPTYERGIWGGMQSMVVSTETAAYLAYLGFAKDDLGYPYTPIRAYSHKDGLWPKILLNDHVFTDGSVYVMAGQNGFVYYIAWDDSGELHIWEYNETTERTKHYSAMSHTGNNEYATVSIDVDNHMIYAVCGGTSDVPGIVNVMAFNTETRTFMEPTAFEIPFRHTYAYIVPTEDGFMWISMRGVDGAYAGYEVPENSGRGAGVGQTYVNDEINAFRFRTADWNTWTMDDPIPIGYEETFIKEVFPMLWFETCGDVTKTADGKIHVAYMKNSLSTSWQFDIYHAVLDGDKVISNERLFDSSQYGDMNTATRFYESSSGNLYVLRVMSPDGTYGEQNTLAVYKFNDARTELSLLGTFTLPDEYYYFSLRVEAPRNGALPSNAVDCLLPVKKKDVGENHFIYFKLVLE